MFAEKKYFSPCPPPNPRILSKKIVNKNWIINDLIDENNYFHFLHCGTLSCISALRLQIFSLKNFAIKIK